MERLTDRRTAAELKANADNLQELGFSPTISDLRYIKLAEFENAEEEFETFRKAHTATLYECDAENNTECKKTACYLYGGECRHTLDKKFAKHGKWIKGKEWDEWFCSVCCNRAYLDYKENPILSDHCPHCGVRMGGD